MIKLVTSLAIVFVAWQNTSCTWRSTENSNKELISAEASRNVERCRIDEPILMRCEYEAWGKNSVIVRIDGTKINYRDMSDRTSSSELEFDPQFPGSEYSIGNVKKDIIYKKLEKSGYCAFSGIFSPKTKETDVNKKIQSHTTLTLFIPPSILVGLVDEGPINIRRWKDKKPTATKNKKNSDLVSPPPTSRAAVSNYEEFTASCTVQLRGRDKETDKETDKEGDLNENQEPNSSDHSKDLKPEI